MKLDNSAVNVSIFQKIRFERTSDRTNSMRRMTMTPISRTWLVAVITFVYFFNTVFTTWCNYQFLMMIVWRNSYDGMTATFFITRKFFLHFISSSSFLSSPNLSLHLIVLPYPSMETCILGKLSVTHQSWNVEPIHDHNVSISIPQV